MSVPAYPEYKDSGLAWLGAVPSHWDITRLKQVCEVFPSNVDKKSVDGEAPIRLCNYTDVYYNDVILADQPFMEATATDEQICRFTLQAGDTIITKDSETADDIARSAYVPNDLPGIVCGYHLSMIRPRPGTHGAFIKRYFDSSPARAYFHVRANGLTRVGLGQYVLDNAPIALPPTAEQTAIATFLDRETAKIDGLVAEQERLIALLKEKRQAVISHAVTKGLNPNAPMKDSGIEWLGDVPAHWTPLKLGRAAFMQEGPGLRTWQFTSDGTRVICVTNITDVGIDFARLEKFISIEEYEASYQHFTVEFGDVLLSSSGNSWGKVAIYEAKEKVILNTSTIRLSALKEIRLINPFIALVLQSDNVRDQLELAMTGACQPNFGPTHLNSVMVAVPPISEQNAIVEFLARTCSKLNGLIAEAQSAITLLQERRAALISAAVTGKIDVRTAVATPSELEIA